MGAAGQGGIVIALRGQDLVDQARFIQAAGGKVADNLILEFAEGTLQAMRDLHDAKLERDIYRRLVEEALSRG